MGLELPPITSEEVERQEKVLQDEMDALMEAKRAQWVKDLPTRGLWGSNPVPRGEVRGSYRIIPESPMHLPIVQGLPGSVTCLEGPGMVEDLRFRYPRGNPERIFSKAGDN